MKVELQRGDIAAGTEDTPRLEPGLTHRGSTTFPARTDLMALSHSANPAHCGAKSEAVNVCAEAPSPPRVRTASVASPAKAHGSPVRKHRVSTMAESGMETPWPREIHTSMS